MKRKAINSKDMKKINGSNTLRTKVDQNISLSREAKVRLRWIEHYQKFRSARLTCRHFGISPDTFYLWLKRFDSSNLLTLEDDHKTRRPKSLRIKKYAREFEEIKLLRKKNPKLGKIRITRALKTKGIIVPSATVGRMLAKLT